MLLLLLQANSCRNLLLERSRQDLQHLARTKPADG